MTGNIKKERCLLWVVAVLIILLILVVYVKFNDTNTTNQNLAGRQKRSLSVAARKAKPPETYRYGFSGSTLRTSDRICLDITECTNDELELQPPTKTSDRVCVSASELDNRSKDLKDELWTPQLVPLIAWFDAADLSSLEIISNKVRLWRDKSGNGLDLLQSTAAAQPTYGPSLNNGKPTVVFNGSSSFYKQDNLATFIGDNDYTIFTVLRTPTTSSNASQGSYVYAMNAKLSSGAIRSRTYLYFIENTSTLGMIWGDGSNVSPNFTVSPGENVMLTTERLQGSICNQYQNATLHSSMSGNFPNPVNEFTLGSWTNGTGGFSNPFISEMVITYNSSEAAYTQDRLRIEGYLAHKWGLTLPPDHPYSYSPPLIESKQYV